MQRESTFRLTPNAPTEISRKKINQIRALAIDLYDAIAKISYSPDEQIPDSVFAEIQRCTALAKTKLQECTFWANRAASYLGQKWSDNE